MFRLRKRQSKHLFYAGILLACTTLISCKGPRFTYTTITDSAGTQNLGADVVSPTTSAPADGFPVILLIHGGGWDSKTLYDDGIDKTIERVAAAGYVGVTIDYRLTAERLNADGVVDINGTQTRNPWPAQIQDAKCAVRWIRANASNTEIFTQKINPGKIGVMGISSGGQMALMLGETANVSEFESDQCPYATSSEVQAVVAYAPLADVEGAWGTGSNLVRPMYQRLLSLLDQDELITTNFADLDPVTAEQLHSTSASQFVTGNSTPVRLIHALNDILAFPQASSCYFDAVAATGRERSMLWFGKGGHLFDSGTRIPADQQMLNWFDQHLKGITTDLACTECVTPVPAQVACNH